MFALFQKKSKILSQHLVVRPQLSWQFYLTAFAICCTLLFFWSWLMYETGKQAANQQEDMTEEKLSYLFEPGICRQTKKQKLCTQVGDLVQQLQISSTASQNLAGQVKSLTQENDHLKEKLAFFQHLAGGNAKSGISVYQFSLKETQTPGKYRYTLTLIQGGERPSDFKGSLRFQVKLLQNEQSKIVPLINKNSTRDFPVDFKFLHRLEESFKVPPDTFVENIQVQIYKNGGDKAILTETAQPAS